APIVATVADLHQEFTVATEFQNLVVFCPSAGEPDVILRVHVNTVLEFRPLIAGTRTTPGRKEIPGWIEFEHRRCGAIYRANLVRLQRRRAVDDPYMIF